MASRLIGLGGYAKAGKDTFADALVEHHGWRKTFMSRPLEEALLRINPWVDINCDNWVDGTWPRETLWNAGHLSTRFMRYRDLHAIVGYQDSKNNHDVRDYLQKLGTEVGRDMCDPDVWLRWAFREIDTLVKDGHDVTLTGIRYPNELAAIKQHHGISVWVKRPGYGPVNEHTSDNTLGPDDFDVVIDNNSTLNDLVWSAHYFDLDRHLWDPEMAA